jgi:hypothetical protein
MLFVLAFRRGDESLTAAVPIALLAVLALAWRLRSPDPAGAMGA